MGKTAFILIALLSAGAALGGESKLPTELIEKLTGLKGKLNEKENVYKVTSPRTDVPTVVDQWTMPPFMGLTSWAAFTPAKMGAVMVMGDLVLFEDEVNPAMSAALNSGLQVTALHNHFFFDQPRVFFMHIAGDGKTENLAKGVHAALDAVRQVRAANPAPARGFGRAMPDKNSIAPEPLRKALAVAGETKGGMFKAVFGRKVKMLCGCEAGSEMGVNTWAAFAGTDSDALVDGDFAVLEEELQPVLKSLRRSGINIVAIHQHMTGEQPRLLFLHYWGRGPAEDLAKAVKAAVSLQK